MVGNYGAAADFTDGFAPADWTFSGSATSNSLMASQMQITSFDDPIGGYTSTASYTITVPGEVLSVSFDYSYVTRDVNGSSYDLAKYGIDGVTTNLVASNIPQNGTASGSVTLTNLAGKSFSIIQEASDSILGSATITITGFNATSRSREFLVQTTSPALSLTTSIASCNPGTYKYARKGSANVQSLIYTLYVDDKAVSRLVHDPSRSLSPGSYALIDGPAGTASATGATWDLSKLSNYKVYCEVSAHTSGASLSSTTETLYDSAYYAAIEAKKAAEETARQAALVEFNSKENRELRKRLAARGIRG